MFGQQTRLAVVAFQRARHLTADGVAGAATWRALLVTLSRGSTGPAVRAVQDQANFRNGRNGHSLDVDGRYGRRRRPGSAPSSTPSRRRSPASPWTASSAPLTWQALVTEALSG